MVKSIPKMLKSLKFKREHIPYLVAFALIAAMYLPRTFAASTVEGTVFKDLNRNGIQDPGEEPVVGVPVILTDMTTQNNDTQVYTDANGHYTMTERSIGYGGGPITDGPHMVIISNGSPGWWDYNNDWVSSDPTKIVPSSQFQLVGSATVNLPIRPIVRSTDITRPLSTYVGPSGLTTKSYIDVYTAQEVYDAIMRGGYIGEEAKTTTMSVAAPNTINVTAVGYSGTPGNYVSDSANGNCTYTSVRPENSSSYRIDDSCLNHEYGHAWSYHYAPEYRQDPGFTEWQKVRGIDNDSRVDTPGSHQWSSAEMIAEDYRQLLGSPRSQAGQENWELPAAKDVPGLKDYLVTTFRTRLQTGPPPDTQPPAVPTNLHATSVSANSISFAWDPSTDNVGVTKYEVYRLGGGQQISTQTTTAFTETGLSPETGYGYSVIAYDAAGNPSELANWLYVTTPSSTTPPPPSASNVVISALSISPNPVLLSAKANPVIKYSLSQNSTVSVSILNSTGGLVRKVAINTSQSGNVQLTWDRKDATGRKVRGGSYKVKVDAQGSNGTTVTQTLTFTAK